MRNSMAHLFSDHRVLGEVTFGVVNVFHENEGNDRSNESHRSVQIEVVPEGQRWAQSQHEQLETGSMTITV